MRIGGNKRSSKVQSEHLKKLHLMRPRRQTAYDSVQYTERSGTKGATLRSPC